MPFLLLHAKRLITNFFVFPFYTQLTDFEWKTKIEFFYHHYFNCNLCPRTCFSNRSNDNSGICKAKKNLKISSYNLHFGEEPPISGISGSGTVFFSRCTLNCIFCQNYPISQHCYGKFYKIEDLAEIFLYLQKKGAHNINLVSPTPYLYHFVSALFIACKQGLNIPIVYNTSGYERLEIIQGLNNLIDIYLPDFKYSNNKNALRFSSVNDYCENAITAIQEMFGQRGALILDENGIGNKGIIIRHLILPGQTKNSKGVLTIIAESSFKNSYLSLMSQFFPAHKAIHSNLKHRITLSEYLEIKEYALSLGFSNGWFQDIQ